MIHFQNLLHKTLHSAYSVVQDHTIKQDVPFSSPVSNLHAWNAWDHYPLLATKLFEFYEQGSPSKIGKNGHKLRLNKFKKYVRFKNIGWKKWEAANWPHAKHVNCKLRPLLYGLGYPRQPFPRGNYRERLYVKTWSL